MLKFIKHNLEGIDGVEIYPIISLLLLILQACNQKEQSNRADELTNTDSLFKIAEKWKKELLINGKIYFVMQLGKINEQYKKVMLKSKCKKKI